ncbi:uncharacterized protein L203_101126 [Cryptococcus depauperatus CBS 7841]|uniref:HIT domain-containing protein n=1 Tax=Cryptococcus depauperatus CBS 7841 TaxID=1295531 RepID=A0AAJ8JPE1_9TREE
MAVPNNPQDPMDLLTRLPQKFQEARQSGQLFFFPSEAKDVYSDGRRFNIRLCQALQDKAQAKADALSALQQEKADGSPDKKRPKVACETEKDQKIIDNQNQQEPFKPPYVPELFLGSLEGFEGEEGMSILLNKYAVLPEHMLLTPFSFQPQSLPPTPPQLALAYLILLSASRHPTRPRKMLSFYNGGEGAGASQPWRHLQFIEVPSGRAPIEEWIQSMSFERKDKPLIVPDLPYLHIVHPLPSASQMSYPLTPESIENLIDTLAPALMKLLDMAFDAARRHGSIKDGGWNLLMTLEHIHLIPRTRPSFPLPDPHPPLELNSLGYAGLMLVRSQEEEDTLMQSVEGQGGLMSVLAKCGMDRVFGEQVLEAEVAFHGHMETEMVQ